MLASLLNRELRGGAVHRLPFIGEYSVDGQCSGTVMNNPGLTGTPAFAAQYSKVYNGGKLLAIADEEGYVSIVDTAAELPMEMADDWGPNKPRAQWLAHRNAVFDLAWCNDDQQMLTASGDQTISLWDTGHADMLASFRGHSGSVKTVCPMPATSAVFASGARDGALMVWDARVPSRPDPTTGDPFHSPVVTVQDAHALNGRQKRRRTPLQGRTRPSVTSLTFLQGSSNQLATGGVDGVVKFWDLRQAAGGAAAASTPALELARLCDACVPAISQKQHGITSLALHPQGSQLLVSLMGGHHFVYDPLRPHIGPTRWFGGHTVASFYVKAAWSPGGTHIISGSTDRSVYIWEVDAPDGATPFVLPGHQGEVTAVAWCPSDFHQIATTADDATLKVWHLRRQQPEEQADDGAARQPWVYPWQQQQQVQAAAAAAAAFGEVGSMEAVAAAAAAGTPGVLPMASADSATPWPSRDNATGALSPAAAPGGSSSLLAALRGGARAAAPGSTTPAPASLACLPLDENLAANLQQQQQQQQAAAGAASVPPPAAVGASGRLQPFLTPFAGGAGSPAMAARTAGAATAGGGSSRPPVRRISIGDLLSNPAPSTRRTKQQRSIASFLRSPAAAAAKAGSSAAAAEGQASLGRAAAGGGAGGSSSRDLPDGGGSARKAAGGAGTAAAAAGAAAGAAGSAAKRAAPLPAGLGGSCLPSPRAKRLRTSFESAAAAAGAAGAAAIAGPSSCKAGAAAGVAPERCSGEALAAAKLASPRAAAATAAAGMQRQHSNAENDLSNV